MSKSLKGRKAWSKGLTKDNDPRIMEMANSKKGRKLTKEQKKRISQTQKGRKHTKEHIINQANSMRGKKHSEKTKKLLSDIQKSYIEKSRNRILKLIDEGKLSPNPKCKNYNYKGVYVQGKSELKWIKENYCSLIRFNKKAFKTPSGLIIPDFETRENIIEVKSLYTFKNMKIRQLLGYFWINKNIKPVKICVDYGNYWKEFVLPNNIELKKVKIIQWKEIMN